MSINEIIVYLMVLFMALGADDALRMADSLPGLKAYFILAGQGDAYEEYVTPAMRALIME